MVAIGIDLGTTSSCVAVWEKGSVKVIPNEQGNRTTPCYVSFTPRERLIGEAAKNVATSNAANTIFGAKRLIGRRYDDVAVQMDLRHWPFQVINDKGKPKIIVSYKNQRKAFAPEEISAMMLFRMKEVAETYLGRKVNDVVITVPAYFNDSQRQATRNAGVIAGFNVLRVLNEPTAAALAYGLDRDDKTVKNVLIYDLGGGTLDVSVLRISSGPVYEVKSTAGNTRLGGDDFDGRLAAYFAEDFKNKYGEEIIGNTKLFRRLKITSERVKRILTSALETNVQIDSLHNKIDYICKVSRSLFEELCSDLFLDTIKYIEQALKEARMKKEDIADVILVGGSTRIPKIRCLVQEYFQRPISSAVNPEEAVASGAAIQAAILSGEKHKKIQDLVLVDVVPLSLGVETARGMMYKVIDRNTPFPCRRTKDLTTLEDYQRSMTIEVFEGERALTRDNNLLGVFELEKIPPAPRGIAIVDVTFDIDVNGMLSVFAQDRSTGVKNGLVISNNNRLSQQDINKMIEDAEAFKEEDTENKRRLEVRNQLEGYVYNVKQAVSDNIDILSVNEITRLTKECKDAIEWLELNADCLREEYERKMTELLTQWSLTMRRFNSFRHKTKRQRSENTELNTEDV